MPSILGMGASVQVRAARSMPTTQGPFFPLAHSQHMPPTNQTQVVPARKNSTVFFSLSTVSRAPVAASTRTSSRVARSSSNSRIK